MYGIKMYTDIGDIEKESESKKVNFKKVFSPEEQKLIMLDTAYYFQRDNPSIFTNVNIIKKKNLADRIQDEDEEHQIKKRAGLRAGPEFHSAEKPYRAVRFRVYPIRIRRASCSSR